MSICFLISFYVALRAGYLTFTRLCYDIELVAYGVFICYQEIEIS